MTASEVQRGSSTESAHTLTAPREQSVGSTDAAAGGPATAQRRGLRRVKVLPEHARAHNRSLVLQTLFHDGAMSRADLSRETGLTRVTISDLVAELIGDGLVAELGIREASGPGKPAMVVDLDRAVKDGKFRDDLYYRINVIPFRMPPLRERAEDTPEFVELFLNRYNVRLKRLS